MELTINDVRPTYWLKKISRWVVCFIALGLIIFEDSASAIISSDKEPEIHLGWHLTNKTEVSVAGQNLLHSSHPGSIIAVAISEKSR
ncbi:MAG: hypothetical protein WDM76_11285 [Limisphaerales bacterium]